MKREMVSANCYKGRRIKSDELVKLSQEGRSVCMIFRKWEVMPAAFLVNMQFSLVMRRVQSGLFLVEKINKKKENRLVQMAVERERKKKDKVKTPSTTPGDIVWTPEPW